MPIIIPPSGSQPQSAYEDDLHRILPYASDCPPSAAIFHLREAAADFFQRTLAWREDLPVVLSVVGAQDYTLTLPGMTKIAKLLRYTFDGAEKDVVDAEVGERLAIDGSMREAAWTLDRLGLSINPRPVSAGKVMTVRVALKPTNTAESLPEVLHDQYIDHIASGALARILALPDAAWSDQALADRFEGRFELAVARVGLMTSRGFRGTGRRGTAVFF